jgi:uncharacterized membrane protein YfcA
MQPIILIFGALLVTLGVMTIRGLLKGQRWSLKSAFAYMILAVLFGFYSILTGVGPGIIVPTLASALSLLYLLCDSRTKDYFLSADARNAKDQD